MNWSEPAAFRVSSDAVFNIQIQHPRTPLSLFDAVITPEHDVAPGSAVPDNLHLTTGTVKRIIEERLASELEASHELFIWNGEGPNPYLAFLHHSSDIVATPDSVSMITEAILSGKRVHVIGAEHMKGKFGRFHTTIRDRGYVSRLQTAHESAPTIRASCGNGIEQELEDITSKLASQILERIS
ncbi:hypothetical protein ATCC90586_002523 [Pythium insidiosum]|nr:hypothetical protein ATCC90586_002523 [Pythium insidiosum]